MDVQPVKQLMDLTGLPFIVCLKVLRDSDNDVEEALELLRERRPKLEFTIPRDHYLVDKDGNHVRARFRPDPPDGRGVDTWLIEITEFDFERFGLRKIKVFGL